jgi:hypothetical protein
MHCQIVGPPGIGKTALLSNVGRIAAGLDEKFQVAYVDLSDPQCQTLGGFLGRVSAAWGITPPCARLIDLAERVHGWRRSGTRPVLCLDNFEEMLRHDREFTSEFFVELRGVAQAGLTIITASRETLSALMTWYSRTSPFFNVFEILRLGPLPPEGAEQLLQSLCAGGQPFTPPEREELLRFAGGHPLTLQVACAQAVQAKGKGEGLETALQRAAEELQSRLRT